MVVRLIASFFVFFSLFHNSYARTYTPVEKVLSSTDGNIRLVITRPAINDQSSDTEARNLYARIITWATQEKGFRNRRSSDPSNPRFSCIVSIEKAGLDTRTRLPLGISLVTLSLRYGCNGDYRGTDNVHPETIEAALVDLGRQMTPQTYQPVAPSASPGMVTITHTELELLHENGLPAIMRLSNSEGRTVEIQANLWGVDPTSDQEALKILRDIHEKIHDQYGFRKDDRTECVWRTETFHARTHCFFTINGIHEGSLQRTIVYGCNHQRIKPIVLGVDEYWRLQETFWEFFDRVYRGKD